MCCGMALGMSKHWMRNIFFCKSIIWTCLQYFQAAVLEKNQPHVLELHWSVQTTPTSLKYLNLVLVLLLFQDAEGNPIDIQIKSKPDGVFACSYVPVKPIKHTISVVWGGANVPNSPFRVSTEMDVTDSSQVAHSCSELLCHCNQRGKTHLSTSRRCVLLSPIFQESYPLEKKLCLDKLLCQRSPLSPATALGNQGNSLLVFCCSLSPSNALT